MRGGSSQRLFVLAGFQNSSDLGSEHGGFGRFLGFFFGVVLLGKVDSKKEHAYVPVL